MEWWECWLVSLWASSNCVIPSGRVFLFLLIGLKSCSSYLIFVFCSAVLLLTMSQELTLVGTGQSRLCTCCLLWWPKFGCLFHTVHFHYCWMLANYIIFLNKLIHLQKSFLFQIFCVKDTTSTQLSGGCLRYYTDWSEFNAHNQGKHHGWKQWSSFHHNQWLPQPMWVLSSRGSYPANINTCNT